MNTIIEHANAIKGDAITSIQIHRLSDTDCRVYQVAPDGAKNWDVTVGRRFESVAKAVEFIEARGWTVTFVDDEPSAPDGSADVGVDQFTVEVEGRPVEELEEMLGIKIGVPKGSTVTLNTEKPKTLYKRDASHDRDAWVQFAAAAIGLGLVNERDAAVMLAELRKRDFA